jgi:hypothetical protein
MEVQGVFRGDHALLDKIYNEERGLYSQIHSFLFALAYGGYTNNFEVSFAYKDGITTEKWTESASARF